MLPNDVNVLPIVSRTRRITLPFHKEVNLTLSLGTGRIATFLACLVSISRVREELPLKTGEPFPSFSLRWWVWEIFPSSFKMPFFNNPVDVSAFPGQCLPMKIVMEKTPPHFGMCNL